MPDSIEHAHRRGFTVYISTNPSVWTEERIEDVLDTGLDRIQVMFDGMDDETSMAIRGRAASFVRGDRNLRRLAERKVARGLAAPHITIQMIRHPRNRHQWARFAEYWRDVAGVDAVYLDYYSTFDGRVDAINAIGAELATHDEDQAAEVARIRELAEYPCVYPWHSVSITWDAKVVPCCRDVNTSTILGDLTTDSLETVWNAEPLQRLRAEFSTGAITTPTCTACREPSLEVGLPTLYPLAPGLRVRRT